MSCPSDMSGVVIANNKLTEAVKNAEIGRSIDGDAR
jgi:hypothetical protein